MQIRALLIRAGIMLVLLTIFVLHAAGIFNVALIQQLENISYDARVTLTMPGTGDDRVTIVDIDEKSIAAEGQWPWSRDRLALLVDQLVEKYGSSAIGFDITFPEPDRRVGSEVIEGIAKGPLADNEEFQAIYEQVKPRLETDRLFAESLRGRPIVLGYAFRYQDKEKGAQQIGLLPPPIVPADEVPKALWTIEEEGYTANLPILQRNARSGGFFDNPVVDADSVFRRVPAVQEFEGDLYSSLALELVRAHLGWPELEFVFDEGAPEYSNTYLEWLRLGEIRIPVDEALAIYIPYRGPGQTFDYVSASDVIAGTADPALLEDRIILIGTSAPGLRDFRPTPVGQAFIGVEVHANVVAGILNETIKFFPEYVRGAHMALLGLLGIIITLVLARFSVVPATAITLGLAIAVVAANLWFWTSADFIVPLASPLLFIFLLFTALILYGLLIESRGKRYLSQMFGQYIPPELVEEMNEEGGDISMEGDSREMTVLFSDVRGFTSISEGLSPKQLTHLMNEFLTPLTRDIHEHRGTIDKYMGDAVMAFWGAPLPDEDHALHAVEAAMAMVATMRRLQPEFQKKGWPPMQIGVGLNTGIMNVGNMGSEFRMAYTVLGDAVNLGSRLEGLTKNYGVDILASEFTRDAAPEIAFLELDRVRVKGKEKPVAIFEPLGRRDALPKDLKPIRGRHKQALAYYRNQQWDAAEREFFSLSQALPKKKVYQIYLERIAHFRDNPPPADWDGVFTHTTK
ncbi:MAG: adenylate/guanylate cyclase domain-containing protein [Gammaproteobacteria bacterium]|nr:adenylate/guanylate cyclase domain-containing protein [Gammaproteobacteria bacterium]